MTLQDSVSSNLAIEEDYFFIQDHLFYNTFLNKYKLIPIDLDRGTKFNFKIKRENGKRKINPIIRKAKPQDIDEIVSIYTDVYEGTYPYKEMEDYKSILSMISSDIYEFLVFESINGSILGCITFLLNFNTKMGYLRGLMVKPNYGGRVDIVKATVGSLIAMYSKYKKRIVRWYSESRTAHAKSQYAICAGSLSPIAFYPNKDVFYGEVESDILLISYDESVLTTDRSSKVPTFIPEVERCFDFADARYGLGGHSTCLKALDLDYNEITELKQRIYHKITTDRFGYTNFTLKIKGSCSYFSFLYTPLVQNLEKTKYKVNSLEELYVYVEEFKKCIIELCVRYAEVFLSAYKPDHQKIFKKFGFDPRGYIPSWKYSRSSQKFKDCVLFSYYEGTIDPEIQLLPECKVLLNCLGF